MNTPTHLSALALAALCLSSCASPYYYGLDTLYKELPPQGASLPLPKGKTPQVLYAMDAAALAKRYTDAGYVILGVAQAIQPLIPYNSVAAFAETLNASVVITNDCYERTISEKILVPVTETSTTYHSGSVSPSYDVYSIGTSGTLTTAPSYSYSGTSKTYHTRMQERTIQVPQYAQTFYFLAPGA